jgi:hypothetical protein
VGSGGFGDIVAGTCESDEDCPADFSCLEIPVPCGATSPSCPPCACAGCDPDSEDCTEPPECECEPCEEPEPEECDDEVVKVCAYDPEECTSDADCSEGYECVEVEECMGWGCACPACACVCPEGEECPPCECEPCDCPEQPVEECKVVGAYCGPKEIDCDSDAECPEGWECVEFGAEQCLCPACACAPCEEGTECPPCDCPDCSCEDTSGEKKCTPGGWKDGGVMEAMADGTEGGYGEEPQAAANGTDDGGEGGDGAAGGGGEGTGGNENPPADDTGDGGSSGAAASAGDEGGSGACAVGLDGNGGLALLFLLSGLAAVRVFRRSR